MEERKIEIYVREIATDSRAYYTIRNIWYEYMKELSNCMFLCHLVAIELKEKIKQNISRSLC